MTAELSPASLEARPPAVPPPPSRLPAGPWYVLQGGGSTIVTNGKDRVIDINRITPEALQAVIALPDLIDACKQARTRLARMGCVWMGKNEDPLVKALRLAGEVVE